jgi:hypothetical protein
MELSDHLHSLAELSSRKNPQYPLNKKVAGFGIEKIILSVPAYSDFDHVVLSLL